MPDSPSFQHLYIYVPGNRHGHEALTWNVASIDMECSIGMECSIDMDCSIDMECSIDINMQQGHGLQYGHGHVAWGWTCSMDMDMQHGQGHVARICSCGMDLDRDMHGCMDVGMPECR
jgi:hypothetical protein